MWITEILSIMADFNISIEEVDNFNIRRENNDFYCSWIEEGETVYIKIERLETANMITYNLYIGKCYKYLTFKEIFKS